MTYNEYINNILETRGRFSCGEEYHERHHIVPKCCGGKNDEENLIDLFAREHFEVHRLLALENPDNDKLIYAWNRMCNSKNGDYQITGEEYEEARIAFSELRKNMTGEVAPFYGKHHTEETKSKISKTESGRTLSEYTKNKISESKKGEKHPMYGKHLSEEHRAKISKTEKSKTLTDECKKKIGEAHKGKVTSEETKKKLSEVRKGKFVGVENPVARAVDQYDLQGNFIKRWDCIKDAAEELNICYSKIGACCRGERKTCGGYRWKYSC